MNFFYDFEQFPNSIGGQPHNTKQSTNLKRGLWIVGIPWYTGIPLVGMKLVQPTADPKSNQLANELYVISEKSFVALYRLVNRDSQFIYDDTDQYIQYIFNV